MIHSRLIGVFQGWERIATAPAADDPAYRSQGSGTMPDLEWLDPFARFEVVLEVVRARDPVVLRSAPEADPATLAFYDERERLTHEHVAGDLLLVYHSDEARTLLRESLG